MTKDVDLEWISKASHQDSSLISPFSSNLSNFGQSSWLILKSAAQEHLLNVNIEFQRDEITLRDLLSPEAISEFLNEGTISLLTGKQSKNR